MLSKYRLEIQSDLSHITNSDLVKLDGDAEKSVALIIKIHDALKSLTGVFVKMSPFLDKDIKEELSIKREELIGKNKEFLELEELESDEEKLKKLAEYTVSGLIFIALIKDRIDEQLSRISESK